MFCVCVDDVVRLWGRAMERVQISILAKGLKIGGFFWHYQIEKTVWCKLFVNLVYTLTIPIHPST